MSEAAAASLPSPPSNQHSNGSPGHRHSFSSAYSPQDETYSQNFGRPAGPRALNIAPIATKPTSGLVIATASSPLTSAYPSPGIGGGPCSGPTSTSYVVPPRPKPGRKPATDEPASKRKAQNRESQRAFRARKAAKLNEMKTEAELAEMRHRQDMQQKMMEIADQERRIRHLESLVDQFKESQERTAQERDAWKDKALQLEEFVKQMKEQRNSPTPWQGRYPSPATFTPPQNPVYETPKNDDIGCGSCKVDGPCICLEAIANESSIFLPAVPLDLGPARMPVTPAKANHTHNSVDDPFAEREIDFTAQFSSKRPRLDIAFLTQPSRTEAGQPEAGCGFCTADSYCVCRDTSLHDLQSSHSDIAPVRPTEDSTMTDAPPPSNKRAASGPGTCSDCMSNPKQRAWCQRVSQLRSEGNDYFGQPPSSRASSVVSSDIGSPMEPRANYAAVPDRAQSIGCSDAFKLLDGRVPTDRDSIMDWSTLKPIVPASASSQREQLPGIQASQRKYSALELDTASVIATLQHATGPLTPRERDPPAYKDLVRVADEVRRASHSPRM